MDDRIRQAHAVIDAALTRATNEPALLCSFGKDSLVMLDLLASHGVRHVLHLEDLDEVVDRAHNLAVVERYGLTVTKLPRGRGLFYLLKDTPLFTALPWISQTMMLPIPTNVEPWPGDGPWVCMDDKLAAPRGTTLETPRDLFFVGQKLADVTTKACRTFVNLLGEDHLARVLKEVDDNGSIYRLNDAWMCAPLLRWTDADVWAYIHANNVPWSRLVYDDEGQRRPSPHVCCFRCHDPREPVKVYCPKVQTTITNFAALADETTIALDRLEQMGLLPRDLRWDLEAA